MKKEIQIFGPVIYTLGDSSGKASYRVLWYGKDEPSFKFANKSIVAIPLTDFQGGTFWAFEFSVAQDQCDTECSYFINNQEFTFWVPGIDTDSLRIAYASCNGSEAESPHKKPFPGRNALWEHLDDTHQEKKFHLLIQGGDQIYADSVWLDVPFLENWSALPRSEQYKATMPDEVFHEIRDYYFTCYMSYWSQSHVKDVLATIPSLMIWDDHDIFDGWGSWNDRYQASPVYQGVFNAAKEAFYLFQRGQKVPSDNTRTAGVMITLGHTALIAPDLRSERSRKQVMGQTGWRWFENALKTVGIDKKHLLVVSSVPLATSHFSALDPILTGFPSFIARRLPKKINPKQFADDIHDQWRVPAHREEWLKMLNTLLDFADDTDTRVSTVSGEIHLGARSTIKRKNSVIHQFIASGISHKPAHPVIVWFCELLSKGVQDVSDEIDIRMEYFFPKSKKKYLRARNWLALELDRSMELSAKWHAEGQEAILFKD